MKVLWLSPNEGLLKHKSSNKNYFGGWVESLQSLVESNKEIDLAICYLSEKETKTEVYNNTNYYSIKKTDTSNWAKLKTYYGGYKKINESNYVIDLLKIIEDYQPDIIHLFGVETPLATIINHTNVPIVTHIQGLLIPCNNAFFPSGFNEFSFLFPFSIREWVLRNGYIYANKSMEVRAKFEKKLLKNCKYFMGRTHWDYMLSHLFSNNSEYFLVNEVLRNTFYKNKGKWNKEYNTTSNTFVIVSTISDTIYKGLDVILKTAKLLKESGFHNFKWKVVGINSQANIVLFFEKKLKIKSEDVNIEYVGYKNEEELCNIELASNVFVHPSYIDNSPNSVCEAQLLGLPVISTNVGGISSLIEHKKTGILVPSNSPYEIVFEIKKMMDFIFAKKISQNGVSIAVKRHDKDDIYNALISTYKKIINSN